MWQKNKITGNYWVHCLNLQVTYERTRKRRSSEGVISLKVVLATTNQGKLQEFRRILMPVGFEIITLRALNFKEEIEETGQSFEENAFIKALTIYKKFELPTIADDSGLEIDALNGFPGIYSARFDGIGTTFTQKCKKILELMRDLGPERRQARFVSAICFVIDGTGINSFKENPCSCKVITAKGECVGQIATSVVGDRGFGYDPIFMFEGRTFAQLEPQQKDKISHRGRALKLFQEKLEKSGFEQLKERNNWDDAR